MFYSGFQSNSFQTGFQIKRANPEVIRNFDYNDYVWARVERKKRKKDVEEVIEKISLRQSKRLLTDKQKVYNELVGELTLKGLEFEAVYLEALNYRREQLISEEISKLLKLKIQKEEEEILMMLSAIVANRMI